MGAAPDFGDLRSLMNEPYSRQIWDQLCTWVEQWDPQDRAERVLPYLDGHLHQWLDEERFVPPRWIERLLEDGKELPYVAVARYLSLRGHSRKGGWRDYPTLAALWSSPSLESITILDMGHNALQDHEWELMFACEHMESLEQLRCAYVDPEHDHPGWLKGLKNAPFAKALVELDINACKLEEEECEVLFEAELTSLRALDISNNNFTMDTITRIAQNFPQLTELVMGGISVGSRSLEPVRKLEHLRRLDLSNCNLQQDHFEKLGVAGFASQLTHLTLWGNRVGVGAIDLWLGKGAYGSLRELNLGKTGLDDIELAKILDSPHVETLEVLELPNNSLTDTALGALRSSGRLKNLRKLNLLGNKTTAEGASAIKEDPVLGPITRIR